jgi:hypothetical protein
VRVVYSSHSTILNRHHSMKLSQLSHESFERDTLDSTNAITPEISNTGRAYSSARPHITMDILRASPPIIHTPDILDTIDSIGHAGISNSSKMTGLSKSFQPVQCPDQSPVQSKLSPPSAKTACLRCRGKKSRCSGQRPCRGCSNSGLECTWEEHESESAMEPERPTRNSRSAQGADTTSRRLIKGKDASVQVRSACTRCQHRKAKCSGTRPACTYCSERSLDCTYSVAEGATRTNDLKRRLRETSNKAHAFGLLLEVMRQGTDEEATKVLARLRIGESLQGILRSLPVSASSPNGEFQSEINRRLSAA